MVCLCVSKGPPHLVPDGMTVYRPGNPFIFKAEFCIVGNQPVFAGQNDALPAGPTGICDHLLQEQAGIALPSVLRRGDQGKDHLPVAALIVHFGMVIHGIRQIPLHSGKAVDKGRHLPVVRLQQPEMIGIGLQTPFQALTGSALRRRVGFRFYFR